jgi:hypothetical protein
VRLVDASDAELYAKQDGIGLLKKLERMRLID